MRVERVVRASPAPARGEEASCTLSAPPDLRRGEGIPWRATHGEAMAIIDEATASGDLYNFPMDASASLLPASSAEPFPPEPPQGYWPHGEWPYGRRREAVPEPPPPVVDSSGDSPTRARRRRPWERPPRVFEGRVIPPAEVDRLAREAVAARNAQLEQDARTRSTPPLERDTQDGVTNIVNAGFLRSPSQSQPSYTNSLPRHMMVWPSKSK